MEKATEVLKVTPAVHALLRRQARRERRPMGVIVAELVVSYVDSHQPKEGETK